MIETSLSSNFTLVRLLGNELLPSICQLKISIQLDLNTRDQEQADYLKAIKFWIDNVLNRSIIYHPRTDIDTTTFEKTANNVIMAPDEPNDYHICILLHNKLNAIGHDKVKISQTEFTSDLGEGFTCTVSGDITDWLPDLEEWIGLASIFDQPWWYRSDGSTIDFSSEPGDNIAKLRSSIAINLLSYVSDHNEKTEHMAEILKPNFFKPTIIQNDE
jgi:hypothetical protein